MKQYALLYGVVTHFCYVEAQVAYKGVPRQLRLVGVARHDTRYRVDWLWCEDVLPSAESVRRGC